MAEIDALRQRVASLERRVSTWRFRDRVLARPRLSAQEIILLWLEDHETVTIRGVYVELFGVGVTSHALTMAAWRLWKAGDLEKLGPGLYRKQEMEEP